MDSCEVSEFDKGPTVMAREMGVSVSVEAVVNSYREWCEKEPEKTGRRNIKEAFLRERQPGKHGCRGGGENRR